MKHRGHSLAIVLTTLVAATLLVVAPGDSPAEAQTDEGGPAASSGCATSTQGPVVEQQQFLDVNGSSRWFLLTVPGAHDGTTPLPVVFSFHGLSEGAQIHTRMSEFSGIAQREGFVVVFPHGRFDPVRWDASATSDPNEDIDFVNAILDTLGQQLCIDQRRVYAAGLSYGAFMTSLVTCKLSERFAAVAPVAGIRLTDPCPQARDVPIVTFHGTEDTFVPYAPTPGIVAGWASRNGCGPTPTDTAISAEVTHRVYDCPPGADVEFFIVTGGGHAWPGSAFSHAIAAVVGYTTFDIHASEEAWQFFQRFQLPCPEGSECPSTADDIVAIECGGVAGTIKAKPALTSGTEIASLALKSAESGPCTGPLASTVGALSALKGKLLGAATCGASAGPTLRPLSGNLSLVWTEPAPNGKPYTSKLFARVGKDPAAADVIHVRKGLVTKGPGVGQDFSGSILHQPVRKGLVDPSTIDATGRLTPGAGSAQLALECAGGISTVTEYLFATDGTTLAGAPFSSPVRLSLPA